MICALVFFRKAETKLRLRRERRKLIFSGSILDVYSDHMVASDGSSEEWDFVSHRDKAAAALPILPSGKIALVRQYRPAVEQETLEIPAGLMDPSDADYEACAARELEEETGWRAGRMTRLLYLIPEVAFCDEVVPVYLAEELQPAQQHLDPHEYINVEEYTLKECMSMVRSAQIRDAKTVAALCAYQAFSAM